MILFRRVRNLQGQEVELSIQRGDGIERAIYTHILEKHEVATRKEEAILFVQGRVGQKHLSVSRIEKENLSDLW